MKSGNVKIKYLALGDSYTIGEAVERNDNFPNQLCAELKIDGYLITEPDIIAKTGWKTQDLLDAIESAELKYKYDLVTLLIGVNNQYQNKDTSEYAKQFEILLKKSIAFAGNDKQKVFVVSIPDYGYSPFGENKKEKVSAEIDIFNSINKRVSAKYAIRYVDITFLSRSDDPELIATDGLHPSAKQYALWVDKIKSAIFLNGILRKQ